MLGSNMPGMDTSSAKFRYAIDAASIINEIDTLRNQMSRSAKNIRATADNITVIRQRIKEIEEHDN